MGGVVGNVRFKSLDRRRRWPLPFPCANDLASDGLRRASQKGRPRVVSAIRGRSPPSTASSVYNMSRCQTLIEGSIHTPLSRLLIVCLRTPCSRWRWQCIGANGRDRSIGIAAHAGDRQSHERGSGPVSAGRPR